ncbi:hypothetical protein IAU60_003981 [Kwoniella sp. DSM 27419]
MTQPLLHLDTLIHSLISFTASALCAFIIYSTVTLLCRRYGSITLTSPRLPARLDNGDTVRTLVERCVPSLQDGYRASWWLPNGHLQTIYSALGDFAKDDPVTYERCLLLLPDGGTVGIDIFPPLAVDLPAHSPVIMINHGLTGGSHESYVRNIVLALTKPLTAGGLGGRAVVVNFRGCASTPLTSPHLYSTGSTIDLHTAILYMASLFPDAPMLGVGFSTGAAVMTRYLGEQGSRCRLKAGIVLCCPLELRATAYSLDSQHIFPRIYSLSMAHKILRSLAPHLLPSSPLSWPSSNLHVHLPEILSLSSSRRHKWTLRASRVLELVAAKVGGSTEGFPFGGLEDFLEWACPGRWIGRIRRPTLALSARDDPIVSGDCLPFSAVRESTHFVLATVPQGGHLGWFDGPLFGPDRHRRWHVRPVLEFLRNVVSELPDLKLEPVVVRRQGRMFWAGEAGWEVVGRDPRNG